MPNYAASNLLGGTQQNLSTSFKTLVALTAATATLKRGRIYDLLVGTDGTPADNACRFDISRQTAAGTSTSITPNALDPADVAAGTVGSANFTAEGTITANSSVLQLGLNQRASYRWVAAPGGELVWPATNLAGLAIRANSPGYTSTATAQAYFNE